MIRIEPTTFRADLPFSSVFDPPYANLMPIVDALVSRGNSTTTAGFVNSQGGWYCAFAEPIDYGFIRAEFELPDSIGIFEDGDGILDKLSWCSIDGPAAVQIAGDWVKAEKARRHPTAR